MPVQRVFESLVDAKAKDWMRRGLVRDTAADRPFHARLGVLAAQLPESALGEVQAGMDIYETLAPELHALCLDDRLLDAVQALLGAPEITISPILHVRPHVGAGDKDELHLWHCDQTVTVEEADGVEMVTAWMPLVNVDPSTGCMQFARGGHVQPAGLQHGHFLTHEPYELTAGCRLQVDNAPMKRGDVVLFSATTPHRGQSVRRLDFCRWSADLRFQRTGTPSGRPQWPSFVVRSECDPSSVERDPKAWAARWRECLERSPTFRHRNSAPLHASKANSTDAAAEIVAKGGDTQVAIASRL